MINKESRSRRRRKKKLLNCVRQGLDFAATTTRAAVTSSHVANLKAINVRSAYQREIAECVTCFPKNETCFICHSRSPFPIPFLLLNLLEAICFFSFFSISKVCVWWVSLCLTVGRTRQYQPHPVSCVKCRFLPNHHHHHHHQKITHTKRYKKI